MGAVGLSFQGATYLANPCDQRKDSTFLNFSLRTIWICELRKYKYHLLQSSTIHSGSSDIFVLVEKFHFHSRDQTHILLE